MTRWSVVVVAVLLLAACSGGSDGDDDGASLGDTLPATEVTVPDIPEESPPGTGVVVVGVAVSSFAVTGCQLDPADAGQLLRVTGAGTTGRGDAFEVEVQRFSSATAAAETFTDTITYSDTARILQIQRFEVAGSVTDLRDPDARSTLLRVRPGGVAAAGLAGPPGTSSGSDRNDDGIVGFALDLTC